MLNFREKDLIFILKSSTIFMAPSIMLITLLLFYEAIDIEIFTYSFFFIFVIAQIFIYPYAADLRSLIKYVDNLVDEENVKTPPLSFLNNVEELSRSIKKLHKSWQKREEKLRHMLEESSVLIDSQPHLIIILDKKNNIVKYNKTAEKIFGTRKLKKIFAEILSRKEMVSFLAEYRKDQKKYQPIVLPVKNRFAQGGITHFLVNLSHFPKNTYSNIDLIAVLHDVSMQKHYEQSLTDFIANASHELRTPLTSIIGLVETLKRVNDMKPERREEFLDMIDVQAQKMAHLTNSLLSLSLLEADKKKKRKEVDVINLIRQSIEHTSISADKNQNLIKLETYGEIPNIFGVEGELVQVFDNIISNAIKYSPPDLAIDIVIKMLEKKEVSEFFNKKYEKIIEISVIDNGIGIDKKHLNRITERFYRVSDTSEIEGSGLGLAIVAKIIERHKGKLEIESEENEGSKFTVLLPVLEEKDY